MNTAGKPMTVPEDSADCKVRELCIQTCKHIISFLDPVHDAETLANCGLVCKKWLVFSRYALYTEVHLNKPWKLFHFSRLLSNSTRAEAFGPLVRKLYITAAERNRYLSMPKEEKDSQHADPPQSPLLHNLSCLTMLSFTNVDWTQECADSVFLSRSTDSTGHKFQSLTRLELKKCSFKSVVQLQDFTCVFPKLSVLALTEIRLQETVSTPRGSPILQGPRLATLYLEQCNKDTQEILVRWLVASKSVQLISNLRWTSGEKYNSGLDPYLLNLLANVDGSLKKVELSTPTFPPVTILSRHNDLRSLTLDVSHDSISSTNMATLYSTLAALSNPQLESLSLTFKSSAFLVKGNSSWYCDLTALKNINNILCDGSQFRGLRSLEVSVNLLLPACVDMRTMTRLLFRPSLPSRSDYPDMKITDEDQLRVWVEEVWLKTSIEGIFKCFVSRGILKAVGRISKEIEN